MDKNIDVRFEELTAHINKLKIDPGDLIVFRVPKIFNPPKRLLEELSRHVGKQGGFLVFAAKEMEVEKFNVKQMEKLGWVRKERDENSKD